MTDLRQRLADAGIEVKPLVFTPSGDAKGYGCDYLVYETTPRHWNAVVYGAEKTRLATGVAQQYAVLACNADHLTRILAALQVKEGRE